jgi:hypothetical protein
LWHFDVLGNTVDYGISFRTLVGRGNACTPQQVVIMYIMKDTGIRMETNILFEII